MPSKTYRIKTGPFVFSIDSDIALVQSYIAQHYASSLLEPSPELYTDYYLKLLRGPCYRRLISPQARFWFNEREPFKPLPLSQAHAMLEWGMNWIISATAHQYLIIHSAVLEKDEKAILISAPPGAGKSTLCAYLASRGWRLLSDELALLCPDTLVVKGLARPINLKNRSMELMQNYFPADQFSVPARDTHKGDVCLLKAPDKSIDLADTPSKPALCLFVAYTPGEACYIEQVNKCKALTEIISNSFNFSTLGKKGFLTAKELVKQTHSYYIEYSQFEAAEEAILKRLAAI